MISSSNEMNNVRLDLWALLPSSQDLLGSGDEDEDQPHPLDVAKSLIAKVFYETVLASTAGDEEHDVECKTWMDQLVSACRRSQSNDFDIVTTTDDLLAKHSEEIETLRTSLLEAGGGYHGLLAAATPLDGFVCRNDKEVKEAEESLRQCCPHCRGLFPLPSQEVMSHSSSLEGVRQLFAIKLGLVDNLSILDIGSGLGSVLFSAYYYTQAKHITGLEINSRFAQLVNTAIKTYGLDDNRIKVIHGDLKDHAHSLLRVQDVVIFNNAFEYFVSREDQCQLWRLIKDNLKSGTYLVTNPKLEKLIGDLKPELADLIVDEWVAPFDEIERDREKSIALAVAECTDENFNVYIVK